MGEAASLLVLIFSGSFSGPRAKWGGFFLGLLVLVDLGRADLPWIKYWDYAEKYATNPIIELLRDKPFEHRVAMLPFRPPASSTNTANLTAGTVKFASYTPKHIVFDTDAQAPSVLLLNDRYDPIWKVSVDGKPETVLRCNYIMRGVYLPPGAHKVEFRFKPRIDALYITLTAISVGVLLCGLLEVLKQQSAAPSTALGCNGKRG